MLLAKQNYLLFPECNFSLSMSLLCLDYALILLGLLMMKIKASVICKSHLKCI